MDGSLDLWICEWVDLWIFGSMLDQRINGSTDQWITLSNDRCIDDSMDQWIFGLMDQWMGGRLEGWKVGRVEGFMSSAPATTRSATTSIEESSKLVDNWTIEVAKQLFCGGLVGSLAKTVTAPFSRLTILFQAHSMVTTRSNRPKFSMSLSCGISKTIERGGLKSLWRGNMMSDLHWFPYLANNFFVYETLWMF
jgi:hypothetical protein